MLIILEGPDLAGKSTLADRLLTYISVKFPNDTVTMIHRRWPDSHPLDEYVTPLLDYRPGRQQHYVLDRWHLGEVAYPRVLKRPTLMSRGVFRYVEAFLAARGAVIGYLSTDEETLTNRYEVRGDEHRSLDDILRVKREFDVVIEESELPKRRGVFTPEQLVDVARYRELTVGSSAFCYKKTYVGSPFPLQLYVGDTRGCDGKACTHRPPHDPAFPAFGPFVNTCGDFLMSALPDDRVPWGLYNVNDVDALGMESYESIDVVALGREASKTLRRLSVPHTVVPHPQYVKRFHHGEVDEYRRLLSLRDRKDHGTWKS